MQACKNIGLKTIPVRVFDIAADDPITALRMEREENEHRMDLTPSEKVEVAKRIEEAVGNRQGQRTDIKPESGKKELMPTLAQVEPGTKTREIAAQSVDMKPETYRKAKAVVESGDNELIHQMDTGHNRCQSVKSQSPTAFDLLKKGSFNMSQAKAISKLSEEQQKEITQLPPSELNTPRITFEY